MHSIGARCNSKKRRGNALSLKVDLVPPIYGAESMWLKGEFRRDRFTGEGEKHFSHSARNCNMIGAYILVSLLCVLVAAVVVLFVMLKVTSIAQP